MDLRTHDFTEYDLTESTVQVIPRDSNCMLSNGIVAHSLAVREHDLIINDRVGRLGSGYYSLSVIIHIWFILSSSSHTLYVIKRQIYLRA